MSEVINIMVNGLPGNMARKVAEHILEGSRFELVPYSLTGPEITASGLQFSSQYGPQEVRLIRPDQKDLVITEIKEEQGQFISVDFTLPVAANANAEFYCKNRLPFVMGTTGGDRKRLNEAVEASKIAAVIAPNMAKQIVGFQAMMCIMSEAFPGLFAGYSLAIRESHQKSKADTSGTARAMVGYFNALGVPFSEDMIVKLRDPDRQIAELGVPKQYLGGHGWHTYSLISPDGTVTLEFTHNVNGRDVYALGALDAVFFLNRKVGEGVEGKVFTMIDVLKG